MAGGTNATDALGSQIDGLYRVVAVHTQPLDTTVNLPGRNIYIDDFLAIDAHVQPNGLCPEPDGPA